MSLHRQACEFLNMLDLTTWNADRGSDMVAGMRAFVGGLRWSSRHSANREKLFHLLDLAEVDVKAPIDISRGDDGNVSATWQNPKQDAAMTVWVNRNRIGVVFSQYGQVLVNKTCRPESVLDDIRTFFATTFGESVHHCYEEMLALAAGPRRKGRGAA